MKTSVMISAKRSGGACVAKRLCAAYSHTRSRYGRRLLDRFEVFKQRDQPDRRQFDRRIFPLRLIVLNAHLPIERDQRFGVGGQADLYRQRHARIAVFSGDGVDLVQVEDGGVDGKLIARGDHALADAGRDHRALQNIPIAHRFAQQSLRGAVGLNRGNQGVQLLAQSLIQRKVIFQHGAALLPQFQHLALVAIVVLPHHLGRIAAQVQARGPALPRAGLDRERQQAAIALLQLMRQRRDVIQHFGETLFPFGQRVEFRQQF